jgi:hypothetical protein
MSVLYAVNISKPQNTPDWKGTVACTPTDFTTCSTSFLFSLGSLQTISIAGNDNWKMAETTLWRLWEQELDISLSQPLAGGASAVEGKPPLFPPPHCSLTPHTRSLQSCTEQVGP